MTPCIYATSGWGVHDERWVAALHDQGFAPTIIRLGIDVPDTAALRAAVAAAVTPSTPVLAGPLDTVTKPLIGIDAPLIGLSCGFDLHDMTDTEWLADLDGIIVDSDATAALARAAGIAAERITFLPWGVDLALFQEHGPSNDFTDLGIPADARIVLSLRAHEPRYRVADILDAFAMVSQHLGNVHLVVGHTGSLSRELQEQANDLGISERTHFIGSVPESDIPTLLRGADVYVSASEVDGTSVTLLQAMACGTPVVVSDTPGNTPWVEQNVSGFLFRTADPVDLATRLQQALAAPTSHSEIMTRQARALVAQRADWHRNHERLKHALTAEGHPQ